MTTARILPRLALAALLALGTVATATAQDDSKFDPSKLTTPPLHHVKIPKPERYVMPNGIVVFLLENHELPVVTGTAYFKTSPLWIPNDKMGVAVVTGQAMRKGGTAAHSGDWLDDRLAAMGASINSGFGPDMASGGFDGPANSAPIGSSMRPALTPRPRSRGLTAASDRTS